MLVIHFLNKIFRSINFQSINYERAYNKNDQKLLYEYLYDWIIFYNEYDGHGSNKNCILSTQFWLSSNVFLDSNFSASLFFLWNLMPIFTKTSVVIFLCINIAKLDIQTRQTEFYDMRPANIAFFLGPPNFIFIFFFLVWPPAWNSFLPRFYSQKHYFHVNDLNDFYNISHSLKFKWLWMDVLGNAIIKFKI